jgi:excisionase family DNA binding protein
MKTVTDANPLTAELNRPVRRVTGLKKLLSTMELAQKLNLSIRQVRTLVHSRKIPVFRVGWRTNLFDPEKVVKALENFEVKAVNGK